MFPNQFDYHRPASVDEAVALLSADPDAKLLAGGHSLVPAMKLRLASPSALVDLSGVDGLTGIDANGKVTIGAMTTYADLRDSKELAKALPIIPETADNVGDPAVQARGTLGGALAHSDPAADSSTRCRISWASGRCGCCSQRSASRRSRSNCAHRGCSGCAA